MKTIVILTVFFFAVTNGNRISGGDVTSITEYPFAAALLTGTGVEATYQQACGGAVITPTAVLSAASCFYTNGEIDPPLWWRVRVGSDNANSGGEVYAVQQITPNPDFQLATLQNDIAVLRTSSAIVMSASVQIASIAGAAYTLPDRQPVTAIGWGAVSATDTTPSEELRHVDFWIVGLETCANRYNALGFTVTSNMVCAGWLDVGIRGQCQGDAGSPLIENGVVVAVHSWTESCGHILYPNINTPTAPYTRWIVSAATATLT